MNIGVNHTLRGTRFDRYQNFNQRVVQGKGSFLYEKVGNAAPTNSRRTIEQSRLTVYDAYCIMSVGAGNKISLSNLSVQASADLKAIENDKYAVSVHTDDGVKGHWRIYNKDTGKTIGFDPKLTSMQIDSQTGKKYLTESDWYGGFMGAWGVDSSLEDLLKDFMGVDELQCTDINENYTLDRDTATGIVSIKRKGAEGNGGSLILEDEEQAAKLEELADIYLDKYPSVITSKSMALTYAKLEVLGYAVRDDTGILTIGIGGMTYMNHQQPEQSWGILYSGHDSSIYSQIKEAFSSSTITGNMISDYEKWVEWLTEKEIDFELTTVDEELERLRQENGSERFRITSSL